MSWEDRSDRIEHDGPRLVYMQIADDIRADIESGALPAGAKLPSGPELAEIYGVSKVTTARAVQELRKDGLVEVTFGRGTFVTRKG